MGSITAANTQFQISIIPTFPAPVLLQGYSADDVFDTDPLEAAEVLMGVDGLLSAGFVFVPVRQRIVLQADSPSNVIFDTWYQAQQATKDIFFATAVVAFPAIGTKYALTQGVLSTMKPTPDARKVLQPRPFVITWQSVLPAPT